VSKCEGITRIDYSPWCSRWLHPAPGTWHSLFSSDFAWSSWSSLHWVSTRCRRGCCSNTCTPWKKETGFGDELELKDEPHLQAVELVWLVYELLSIVSTSGDDN